jgi:NADPH-dependent 2,4-dienoyl-CoA reductase/sulfur reductase-like enzyme
MNESQEFRERVGRIEELVRKIDSVADPALRSEVKELVQALMDLHGGAFERVLEIAANAGESGSRIIHALGRDELTGSILVLYDLHPEPFEARVQRGVEKARQMMAKRGAELKLLGSEEGVVRVEVKSGHSCSSSTEDLKKSARDAIFATAPDAAEVAIEGFDQPANGFVPLANLQGAALQP